ncbi:MAG: helix-turn-helix transcriptional regulator [Acidobacteria bacterium]|nr:helix-turn-helix transcriptional regulator [Acidobacteriota bacterium]MBA3784518.1 helix-turn-helix transcriptional regulator [Acidobacteriota bacterium]MBA4182580.1 helix-turn-helix transcriptional regulator [Acidobacteriota bacterium]
MKVNWKIAENESPILYSNRAEWTGFVIRHWRVLAGEMVEQTFSAHDVKVALAGSVVTQTHTASGAWRTSREEAGSVCLTPAGQPIKAAWETEIECLSITFSPTFVAQTALEQNFSDPLELVETHGRRDPLIQHIALGLLTEASAKEPMGRMYAESLAQTLILHLLKNYSTNKFVQEKSIGGLSGYKLKRAKEFINEHLEEDLTLGQVAEAVGFSQFHFNRAFRRSTGLTPQQYLVQQRINRAKELLTKGDLPLVEVGICAGFKNQSHFTTLFRKFTALTPKAFRQIKHP